MRELRILAGADPAKHGVRQRVRENVYTIPLHRQMIPWAARANVDLVHRPDNVVETLWVRIK